MKVKVRYLVRIFVLVVLVAGMMVPLASQVKQPKGARIPEVAQMISTIGTAAPLYMAYRYESARLGLIAGGLILGPALGYVYAGDIGHGMIHAGIRAAVLGAAVGGAYLICSVGDCSLGLFGSSSGGALAPAVILGIAGIVTTTVLIVRDINHVGDRVRVRNLRRSAISVRPVYVPESRSLGVTITWIR
jgi:hypothetical protein